MNSDAAPAANVLLVRHAESLRERDGDGRLVERLSPAGEVAAIALAERLAAQLAPRHVIYASPWPRSRATAVLLSNRSGAPVYVDDDLQEQWLPLDAGAGSGGLDALRAAAVDSSSAGETRGALEQRCRDALHGALQANPDHQVIFVTHNGVIAALARALGEPRAPTLPHCGVMAWHVPVPANAGAPLAGRLLATMPAPPVS